MIKQLRHFPALNFFAIVDYKLALSLRIRINCRLLNMH